MATEDQGSSIVADAVAAGVALAEPKAFGIAGGPPSAPFVVVPKGYEVRSLEALYPTPYRKKGDTALNDPKSFIAMVNDQGTAATKVYGTVKPAPSFKAVFNDHEDDGDHATSLAGWRDHTATYACPLSAEWQAWFGSNGRAMTQQQFAEFVEQNELDILSPDSDRVPSMKEVAHEMEAKNNASVTQGTRLDNGQIQFSYNEDIKGTVSKGKFEVPQMFAISIPVFDGGSAITIPARFRYRITPGGFTLFYELVRPHKVLEVATAAVWTQIEDGTGRTIFNGR